MRQSNPLKKTFYSSKGSLIYISHIILLAILSLLLTSCNHYSTILDKRIKYADSLAFDAKLEKEVIKAKDFFLTTYFRIDKPSADILNVYIEGDGYAWRSKYSISKNPTPTNPISLKLAIIDQRPNILYIARPCQYTSHALDSNCNSKFWTNARFSKEVVGSINDVIEQFVQKFNIKAINLYGYSGGGGIAVLVASLRKDVSYIQTIAANLDHKEFTKIHKVTPMSDSLNPIDVVWAIKDIPQCHIAGGKDVIVPRKIIYSFVQAINNMGGNAQFKVIRNAQHEYNQWQDVSVGGC